MPQAIQTPDLSSIGRLCERYQRSPNVIEAALAKAGIGPALCLNGVRYYPSDRLDELTVLLPQPIPRAAWPSKRV